MKNTNQILLNLKQTLKAMEIGLNNLKSIDSEQKDYGLRNLIIHGRAVTNVLQNLRSTESDFDQRYSPIMIEMESDKFLKFFYNTRTEILKEGVMPETQPAIKINMIIPNDLDRFEKPLFAKDFFIGDKYGGSGWEILLPDGKLEKLYVELPQEMAVSKVLIEGLPKHHLGKDIGDVTLEHACKLYFNYLSNVVYQAEIRFKIIK